MTRRLAIFVLAAAGALLAAAGVWGALSLDWCRVDGSAPKLEAAGQASAPLFAGAAKVAIDVPWPVTVAGYPPLRPTATAPTAPIHARAIVLSSGALRVALIALELLLIPDSLAQALSAELAQQGMSETWVAATHSHASVGHLDSRWIPQVAGTGRYRPDVEAAVHKAAREAVRQAVEGLRPVLLASGEGRVPELVRARSGGPVDDRLLRVELLSAQGGSGPLARLILLSGHPTLTPRGAAAVSGDYPAALADHFEQVSGGTTLVLQALGGNASVVVPGDGTLEDAPRRVANGFAQAAAAVALHALPDPTLSFARVAIGLPAPDSRRLVPWWLRRMGDNLLCADSPSRVTLSALRVGPLSFVAVPFEVSQQAGATILGGDASSWVVSLANGYDGYVESADRVTQRTGEAHRQYFGSDLADKLHQGVALALRNARR